MGTRQIRDEPDSEPMPYFEAPSVESVPAEAVDAGLRDAVVDLWVRVNDAGGSVGFLPGAARRDVAAALDRHLERRRAARRSLLCVLRDPGRRRCAGSASGSTRAGSRTPTWPG